MVIKPEMAFALSDLMEFSDSAWTKAVESTLDRVHPVDRDALQIWFAFWPIRMKQLMDQAENPEVMAADILLRGDWRLENHIDSSHWFLFGHRYWPTVRTCLLEQISQSSGGQPDQWPDVLRKVTSAVANKSSTSEALVQAMVLIGLRTLQQVGETAFLKGSGTWRQRKAQDPDQVLKQRNGSDQSGWWRFGKKREFQVRFDEDQSEAQFPVMSQQILTAAAANDLRVYPTEDLRCLPGEGPIPIECRSGKCSKCWVGVLGGNQNLDEVSDFERRRLILFGFLPPENTESRPLIRLACQAATTGSCSIVIPTWNASMGKAKQHRTS
jgi:ferredoxin